MAIKGKSGVAIVQKIHSVKDKVASFLHNDKSLADDDERLVSNFWRLELIKMKLNPNKMTADDLLKIYAQKKLTSADVITRARRKVEEEFPSLRGDSWETRQGLKTEVSEVISKPTVEKSKK